MFSLVILNLLILITCSNQQNEFDFLKNNQTETISNNYSKYLINPEISREKLSSELFNIKCFWVNGWNVFDISGLQRTTE